MRTPTIAALSVLAVSTALAAVALTSQKPNPAPESGTGGDDLNDTLRRYLGDARYILCSPSASIYVSEDGSLWIHEQDHEPIRTCIHHDRRRAASFISAMRRFAVGNEDRSGAASSFFFGDGHRFQVVQPPTTSVPVWRIVAPDFAGRADAA